MRASYGLHRITAGMWMEDHEVFSKVTGGGPVFTSAAVSGGGPSPPERSGVGNREGRLPPQAAALEVTRPGFSELHKRVHDP